MSKVKIQRHLRKKENKVSEKKTSEPDKAPSNFSCIGCIAEVISTAFIALIALGLLLRVLKPILTLAIAFYQSHWSWKVTLILIPTILILLCYWSGNSNDS